MAPEENTGSGTAARGTTVPATGAVIAAASEATRPSSAVASGPATCLVSGMSLNPRTMVRANATAIATTTPITNMVKLPGPSIAAVIVIAPGRTKPTGAEPAAPMMAPPTAPPMQA